MLYENAGIAGYSGYFHLSALHWGTQFWDVDSDIPFLSSPSPAQPMVPISTASTRMMVAFSLRKRQLAAGTYPSLSLVQDGTWGAASPMFLNSRGSLACSRIQLLLQGCGGLKSKLFNF